MDRVSIMHWHWRLYYASPRKKTGYGGRKQNWGGDGRGRVMGGVIELVIEWRGGMGVV